MSRLRCQRKDPSGDSEQRAPRRERRVLRDEIRDQLIEQILNGKLAPGERIVEMRIAQQFGVSQAPVREALRDLDLLGFVVSSPFRGAIVRQISVEELVQLYPIRAVLEGLAARHAAQRIDPATLKKLEGLLDDDAHRGRARRSSASRRSRFRIPSHHRRSVGQPAACSRSGIACVWRRRRFSPCRSRTIHCSEIAERHAAVVDALRTHDPDAAERALRLHIEEPGEWLRAALEEEAAEVEEQKSRRKTRAGRRR